MNKKQIQITNEEIKIQYKSDFTNKTELLEKLNELNVLIDMLLATTEYYAKMEEADILYLIIANRIMLHEIRVKLDSFYDLKVETKFKDWEVLF